MKAAAHAPPEPLAGLPDSVGFLVDPMLPYRPDRGQPGYEYVTPSLVRINPRALAALRAFQAEAEDPRELTAAAAAATMTPG